MYKFFGIALVVMALAIGIVPQFTVCKDQVTLMNGKTQPMKCHWSAQAEIAVAIPVGLMGAMTVLSKKKESQRNLAVLGIALGALVMLVPTKLIGVCAMPTHICATTMKPAMLSVGGLVTATSLFGLALTFKKQSPEI
jgi:hypothetical protein